MQKLRANPYCIALLLSFVAVLAGRSATFSGNARVEVNDATGVLGAGTNTISCWFKLTIPSSVTLNNHMVIVMNSKDGNESVPFSYLLRFNYLNGRVEYVARGSSGPPLVKPLIDQPYIERWYHVAVTRRGNFFQAYVDGRSLSQIDEVWDVIVSSSANNNGVSIGGLAGSGSQFLWGEVQEVAIYSAYLQGSDIRTRMFRDQRTSPNIRGYYKLGVTTNSAERFKNVATNAVADTDGMPLPNEDSIAFEETDQGGEQSAFDSKKNGGADAIAPLSGALSWSQTVLSRPTPGIAFDFRISYSSATPQGGGSLDPYAKRMLGPGWRHSFEARIFAGETTTNINLLTWEGAIESWVRSAINTRTFLTRHKEYRGELTRLDNDEFQWVTPERLVYCFLSPNLGDENMNGRLVEIRDFNSNRVQIVWNETEGYVSHVVDTAGGRHDFTCDTTNSRLARVSFGQWAANFSYDAANRLAAKSITNSSGIYSNLNTTWRFEYNGSNLLERITDPRTNTSVFVQYDQYGRKIEERDGLNRPTRTQYGVPDKRKIKHIDPDNFEWIETYDRKHRLLVQRDPLGFETKYKYDEAGNRISITEPLGWTTFFGYDDRANLIARTNALGEVTRWIFHTNFNKATSEIDALGWTNFYEIENATGNLRRHFDALGTMVQYSYSSNGLVEMSIDANGNTNRMAYDSNGFLVAKTDAAGFTTHFAHNDVGWRLAEANALGEVTTYTLDINGNPVRVVDPLNRVLTKVFDENGNLLEGSDAKQQVTRYGYDAANQKIGMTNRAGTITLYSYTQRGELHRVTNAFGFFNNSNVTSFGYDAANRHTSITNALGGVQTTVYDPNGNKIAIIDKTGRRWSKTYDRLNRVREEIDPQGDAKATTHDAVGRIREIITPRGFPSVHFYDGRGRLTNWVDAEGFSWRYDYDGNGNITNITDALGGHYIMAYGPRNERTLERNQDGKEWTYEYDPLLRLKHQTDPNGTTRTLEYDAGGRVLSVSFNTGRVNAFAYDDNNNPEVLSRTGSGPPTISQLEYDAMDRPLEYRDAFGKRIHYAYDALGRIAAITYPDGKVLRQDFDSLHRLTQQVFHFSPQRQFTNTYAYDAASRLVGRSYPNGILQTNTFDISGQITGISYHSSTNPPIQESNALIALTYAYDRNGNKTASTERGTLDWPMPTLTDESASYTPAGRLINRDITLSNPSNSFNHVTYSYDPGGNMTNATGNGQSHTLTYDEDNRVSSVAWDCGITHKSITNRYDAFGRRIARTLDNAETRYVLDLAGSMERILCDLSPNGAVQAYYIHGPDLAFKLTADGALICYHADAMANIIATTGTNATLISQYAYTPYGRSLGISFCTTNNGPPTSDSNPYLFVGSMGVMEELPNLYFMRARYYSAEAAVFLSTDAIRNVAATWKPVMFAYADGNPLAKIDPNGLIPFYGFYCGPNYTGGNTSTYAGLDADERASLPTPVDFLDSACRRHDVYHAHQRENGDLSTVAGDLALAGVAFAAAISRPSLSITPMGTGMLWTGVSQRNLGGFAVGVGMIAGAFINEHQRQSRLALRSVVLPYQTRGTDVNFGQQSLANLTPWAASYAEQRNSSQSTPVSLASSHAGLTSASQLSQRTPSNTGDNSFSRTVQSVGHAVDGATQSVTQAVRNAVASAAQSLQKAVSAVGGFVRRLFGGGSKGGKK